MPVMKENPRRKPGPGRPKGAKTSRNYAESLPSQCPNCGSSERTKYENSVYTDYAENGTQFRDARGLVVGMWFRSCRCKGCDVLRTVREKVYAAEGDS